MTNTKVNLSVSYTNSGTPSITISGGKNNGGDVEVAPGAGNEIVWNAASNRNDWKFAMLSIDTGEGQFCMESFADGKVKITDHNENAGSNAVEYSYRLAIYDTTRDTVFWTPDPKIINKAPGHM